MRATSGDTTIVWFSKSNDLLIPDILLGINETGTSSLIGPLILCTLITFVWVYLSTLRQKTQDLINISPNEAVQHPNWNMGQKISVDSATLMNKIFELIEAQKLFNIPDRKLDILIHPQALVHAIIVLKNGLTKLIYHETSMMIPLVNAIYEGLSLIHI